MESFFAIIVFAFALLGRKSEGKLFNPVTILGLLWAAILYLSGLHLYGIVPARANTYNMFFGGLLSFFGGYYFLKFVFGKRQPVFKFSRIKKENVEYELNYRLIYILALFCIPFYLKDFFCVVQHVGLFADLGTTQKLLQENSGLFARSSLETLLRFFIVVPFVSWVCMPLMAIEFWMGQRRKYLLLLLLTLVLLRVFTTGGRATVIQLAFSFLCVYTFSEQYLKRRVVESVKKKVRRNKAFFLLGGVVLFTLLAFMTHSRAGTAALVTIYYDFSMQPLMFEGWQQSVDYLDLYGLGLASLNGFFFPLDYILRNLLGVSLPDLYQQVTTLIGKTDSEWVRISPSVCANAYVSIFWFFYLDGRLPGILIGMFLYGCFSEIVYSACLHGVTKKSMAIYSFVLVGIFYSFGRFQFSQFSYVLGFLMLIKFMFKKKVKDVF